MKTRPHSAVPLEPAGAYVKKLRFIAEREGEDAQITGGTRSLHRRLLALNLHEAPQYVAAKRLTTKPVERKRIGAPSAQSGILSA